MPFAGETGPHTAGSHLTITLDAVTGTALVEHPHLLPDHLRARLARLLGPGREVACAAPAEVLSAPLATPAGPCVRLSGYWHDSLIEGPGRRSVAKLQGCPIRCHGFIYSVGRHGLRPFLVFQSLRRMRRRLCSPAGWSVWAGTP